MAVLSMFYGIIVSMYYFDNKKHNHPHIHVSYQGEEAIIQIPEGNVIEGVLKPNKMKIFQAWLEIHNDEVMANWELASKGGKIFKIEPLR